MVRILLILFLGLLGDASFRGPFVFAQTESAPETQAKTDPQALTEDHDVKKLEKVLQDYNKDSQKVLKDAEAIKQMQATGEISEEELDKGQLGDPDYEKSYQQAQNILGDAVAKAKGGKKGTQSKSPKYSEAVRVAMKPLQSLSEDELLKMLKENTRGTKAELYVDMFPKMMLFCVRLIKDKEAIPALVSIVDDQDKLIRFGGLMLSTVLVGFFLKRLMKREGRSIPAALGFWFVRFLIMTGLRLGLLYLFYSHEVTPALEVVKSTFF